jgi:hypothetical protein
MSLFGEVVKHVPVDIDTARKAYGREVNMRLESERAAFFAYWAKLNTEFAAIMVDVTMKRTREYQERKAAAGAEPRRAA